MSRRGAKTRVVAYLEDGAVKQLALLEETLHLSRSAVVSQAVARWFHDEPMVRGRLPKRRRATIAAEKVEGQ